MQPLVGVWSDRTTCMYTLSYQFMIDCSYGKRRPFILVGSIAIILSVLLIAHVRSICMLFGWEDSLEGVCFVDCFMFD